MTELKSAMATDAGRVRTVNEDRAIVADGFVAVADGMGGHVGGEVAAELAVESVEHAFGRDRSPEGLIQAAKRANSDVYRRGLKERSLRGMGTTLTAAALVDASSAPKVALVNVGDSRAYLYSTGKLTRLTEDHSLVEEMVRRGELSEDDALTHPHRHILTRVIGVESDIDIDAWTIDVRDGDRLLLCSDGLTNECKDNEIAQLLRDHADPEQAVHALVDRALRNGGSDNVTVVVSNVIVTNGALSAPQRDARESSASPASPIARARREHLVTPFSVLFVMAMLATLVIAAGFVDWYVKASYYVGFHNGSVAIFEGRPGGFLWFKPTVVKQTSFSENSVYPPARPELRQGYLESSLKSAEKAVYEIEHVKASFPVIPLGTSTTTTTKSG
ncbi:MAG: Stp1/IreP family PP2C-type Ser/Thr phosphatase [Acidimicrobiales bacterium]